MLLRRWVLFLVALVLAGCGGSSAAAPSATTTVSQAVPTTTTEAAQPLPPEATDAEASPDFAPIEAYDENVEPVAAEPDETTAWISRRFMTATGIEVVWSAPEGADEYHVHRLPRTGDIAPEASTMTAENRVHTGADAGVFLDSAVTEGEAYWYGIRGLDAAGDVLSVGWHSTAAVTDEEPPSPVELSIELANGAVLLDWNQPEENYELHAYRILRAIGDADPQVVGATWQVDQRSFIDADPPQALTTYSVIAVDFHWNDSEPTEVTVDLS